MTPEASTTKKRSLVQRTTPAPDGDHRKRPRNRATKSCLNCFKSKRMCDRKRPCTRCTQLGLTGLCVYEVDDPQQSSDTQDEQARLKRRVAELEGVIRELKNKPHPRWVLPTLNGDTSANQLWRPRSQSAPTRKGQGMSSTAAAPLNQTSPCSSTSSLSPPILAVDIANGGSYFPPFSLPSPVSGTPSPSARTPIQDFPPDMNHGDAAAHFGLDQDLASLLAVSCQGLVDVHEGILESMPDHFAEGSSPMNAGHTPSDIAFHELCDTQTAMQAHCACLTEPTNYHALLELSLRLRRAADILSRSSHHCSGSYCHLLQRIAELDLLTTNTLGN
ncbi:hypothetical protein PUNSTDRAFT_98398, partial [Punctularia strigosozonata HHB-11173 SS5]|uniref:uncharacterized protein n=1 Tax=Punctularia strigosozonata (strain HHB-11173) TaxID=741275 RepID=UPI0004418186